MQKMAQSTGRRGSFSGEKVVFALKGFNVSASHSQRLSEIRHRILTLLLNEHDLVDV
jgi:hypothetical protein